MWCLTYAQEQPTVKSDEKVYYHPVFIFFLNINQCQNTFLHQNIHSIIFNGFIRFFLKTALFRKFELMFNREVNSKAVHIS
jgi:hypothetical protein